MPIAPGQEPPAEETPARSRRPLVRGRRLALACAAALAAAVPASAQRARAVLSSDSRPYQEVWAGFREALDGDAAMSLAEDAAAPGDARVIVAFGAKAAMLPQSGPARFALAMAPSVPTRGPGRSVAFRVCMTPSPRDLLARMKELQPGLKRLGMVWSSAFYGDPYLDLLREAARDAGVSVESYPLADEASLPDQLRGLHGRVDALWLPPDPLVINERSFLLFRDFALGNRIPLYVPMPGLAERGATASISVSFRAIGRAAGLAAKRVLDGGTTDEVVFPAPAETALNLGAAAAVGLAVPPEARARAAQVFR